MSKERFTNRNKNARATVKLQYGVYETANDELLTVEKEQSGLR